MDPALLSCALRRLGDHLRLPFMNSMRHGGTAKGLGKEFGAPACLRRQCSPFCRALHDEDCDCRDWFLWLPCHQRAKTKMRKPSIKKNVCLYCCQRGSGAPRPKARNHPTRLGSCFQEHRLKLLSCVYTRRLRDGPSKKVLPTMIDPLAFRWWFFLLLSSPKNCSLLCGQRDI